jgi:hypothetical protein
LDEPDGWLYRQQDGGMSKISYLAAATDGDWMMRRTGMTDISE